MKRPKLISNEDINAEVDAAGACLESLRVALTNVTAQRDKAWLLAEHREQNIVYEDKLLSKITEKNKEIERLKRDLQTAQLESISERCARTSMQCCHVCDNVECCDNTSGAKREIRLREEKIDCLRAAHESIADYDTGLLGGCAESTAEWWQDYLRAELDRCNTYWREAMNPQPKENDERPRKSN